MNGRRFLIDVAPTSRIECGVPDNLVINGFKTTGAVLKWLPVKEKMPGHL